MSEKLTACEKGEHQYTLLGIFRSETNPNLRYELLVCEDCEDPILVPIVDEE